MHTAICTFDDPADARRAVDRLLQSGYDRRDVHMEYRHADGTPMETGHARRSEAGTPPMHGEPAAAGQANDSWDSLEREVAMDPTRVRRLGDFFRRLFGQDEGAGPTGTYARAVERGHCVVMVDAHSEEEAERAQEMLHGMEARELTRVHRAGHPPLRDIVGERQAVGTDTGSLEQQFGTAREDMAPGHHMDVRGEGEFPRERERAMASQGWGEQRRLDVVDDDKPIASPDLPRDDADKPR